VEAAGKSVPLKAVWVNEHTRDVMTWPGAAPRRRRAVDADLPRGRHLVGARPQGTAERAQPTRLRASAVSAILTKMVVQ